MRRATNQLANSSEIFTNEEAIDRQVILETPPFSEEIYEYDSSDMFEKAKEDDFSSTCSTECCSDDDDKEQLSFLNRSPDCKIPLPELEPLENHSIMFSNGHQEIRSRWGVICKSLSEDIESSQHLQAAIMRYNRQYIGKWNFDGLHYYIREHLNEEERQYLFQTLLPAMKKLALALPAICTQPIPLLKESNNHCITMSQKQIGCLLSNAFFCTFPRRNLGSKRQRWNQPHEFSRYPDINFNRLFYGTKRGIPPVLAEKLKCLFNYFKRITTKEPSGTVSFHRQYIEEMPNWEDSVRGIRPAVVRSSGFIETEGQGMLQVDFANKFVGGGVLGQGCVQEEIRFIICPELIVSRLFVERLALTEALIITGVEQYNKYSGYSDSFKWEGNFEDPVSRDKWGRKYTQVVAIDAKSFSDIAQQFEPSYIERELNKAYSGFYEYAKPENLTAIATGNWGCGAFKGNPQMKFVIQLMAASQVGRSILYFTFGSKQLKEDLKNIYDFLSEKNLNIGDIWRLLMMYSSTVKVVGRKINPTLLDFLHFVFSSDSKTSEDTDEDTRLDDLESDQVINENANVTNDSSTDIATDVEPT
ncbi:poly(ADP-ribose) glycohydrolase-like isoform X2 [Uloborus diversus]|uniref:poly(ADP-ribose) glycohydrolase-like isoform X2 n=1 Tax=Uloborus diversus TaxID=327109 RepID=UPI00240A70CE|nr:poly(ADP-ribose) glycohydrolase-like isoform X2 [Uloborus diversus]